MRDLSIVTELFRTLERNVITPCDSQSALESWGLSCYRFHYLLFRDIGLAGDPTIHTLKRASREGRRIAITA